LLTVSDEAGADRSQEADAYVGRAKRGDQEAWIQLVRAYETHVFRLGYMVLRDTAEAEEVAQETFIRAYQALATFDEERPLRPWLSQIALNLARNRRRSLGRRLAAWRRLVTREPEVSSPANAVADMVHARTEADLLVEALGFLSETSREAIIMRYYLQMAEAEMADSWQVASGTVKSRLSRALKQLRGVIQTRFPELALPSEDSEQ
jgi:RNA polymerase sigma-70 factor, ECF subfamily